ncbi:MAG: SDR family NAD(P)-dependent oxidoreductase [Brevundimonas sp.]|nr:MAG: SDR family NAD(P)-dependent oxidoreductase [Brevundimonas sp.]
MTGCPTGSPPCRPAPRPACTGAHVIATARTQGGLEDLDDAIYAATGQHATLIPFDLVDGGGIDRMGGALYERFGKLDIWVNAAATMGAEGLTPVSNADPRGFAKVEKTNFTSVYRLIRSLEPLLKASDAARVIHLTTSVASAPRAFWGAYAATKAGAEALMKCWADEIESMPIRVAILDPGRRPTGPPPVPAMLNRARRADLMGSCPSIPSSSLSTSSPASARS